MGGQYWGENGFVRVKSGSFALERSCAWAVPDTFTAPELNNDVHCFEDGSNCNADGKKITKTKRANEVWTQEQEEAAGVVHKGNSSAVSSHASLPAATLDELNWCNKDGVNHCTASLNQHIPQYCGSCWAHGAISAFQDRIKMDRINNGVAGDDIVLSVQHVLNCGSAGSCYGGSGGGTYQWIKEIGDNTGSGVSYITSQPYIACSSDSSEGLCSASDWTCTPENVAVTCPTFGKKCVGLSNYPNATIAEFGNIHGADAMMAEIQNRGPIACEVDAGPLDEYTTGIVTETSTNTNHIISVTGWGTDATEGKYGSCVTHGVSTGASMDLHESNLEPSTSRARVHGQSPRITLLRRRTTSSLVLRTAPIARALSTRSLSDFNIPSVQQLQQLELLPCLEAGH